ncbi:MAG TPA: SDR family NAD(P)-dependent oxidoreductase [Alphaproteobacteria bacterium]|nr:SDR family NAD(P)-dependent oxidoreductase [Alphaproteobacteria bacterium]
MTMSTPETKRLAGRIALVTGASRGIGAAVARRFAAEGAHVIAVARTVGGLEELDDAVKAVGGAATLVPLDLRDLDRIDPLGPQLHARFGRVDVFVANAAILGTVGPLSHHDAKFWEEVFRVNVSANWRLLRTLEPLLRLSDAGRAIFVSSAAAHSARAYLGAYASSKAALEAMARSWAAELANTKIRVNIVDPGATRTAMRASFMPGEDPMSLPAPDEMTGIYVDLASADWTRTGETLKAYRAA